MTERCQCRGECDSDAHMYPEPFDPPYPRCEAGMDGTTGLTGRPAEIKYYEREGMYLCGSCALGIRKRRGPKNECST